MKEHTFLPGNPAYVMRRMNFLRGAPGICSEGNPLSAGEI